MSTLVSLGSSNSSTWGGRIVPSVSGLDGRNPVIFNLKLSPILFICQCLVKLSTNRRVWENLHFC